MKRLLSMKMVSLAVAIALRHMQVFAAGVSSAEYQAGVREAIERYRGDCTPRVLVTDHEYFYGPFDDSVADSYLKAFDDFPVVHVLLHDALDWLSADGPSGRP
jgi:hypothetical protein